jgi:hypothetical protein
MVSLHYEANNLNRPEPFLFVGGKMSNEANKEEATAKEIKFLKDIGTYKTIGYRASSLSKEERHRQALITYQKNMSLRTNWGLIDKEEVVKFIISELSEVVKMPEKRIVPEESDMNKNRLMWIIKGLDYGRLTEWEEEFVESCEDRMKKKGSITVKMAETLERIHKDKTT